MGEGAFGRLGAHAGTEGDEPRNCSVRRSPAVAAAQGEPLDAQRTGDQQGWLHVRREPPRHQDPTGAPAGPPLT